MYTKQGDTPLVVVETGGTGDQLHDAARELAARSAVFVHKFLAAFVLKREPVNVANSFLRHRIETPGVLAFRRQVWVQPHVLHLLGDAFGVLAEFGQRHVTIH